MPMALLRPYGEGLFPVSEAPLYHEFTLTAQEDPNRYDTFLAVPHPSWPTSLELAYWVRDTGPSFAA